MTNCVTILSFTTCFTFRWAHWCLPPPLRAVSSPGFPHEALSTTSPTAHVEEQLWESTRGLEVKLNPWVEPEALGGLWAQCAPVPRAQQMPAVELTQNLGFAVRERDLTQRLHAPAVSLVKFLEYVYLILTGSIQLFKQPLLLLFKDTRTAADRWPGHARWFEQSQADHCSPKAAALLPGPYPAGDCSLSPWRTGFDSLLHLREHKPTRAALIICWIPSSMPPRAHACHHAHGDRSVLGRPEGAGFRVGCSHLAQQALSTATRPPLTSWV